MATERVRSQRSPWLSDYERFRKAKDEFFAADPRSPLSREQRDRFAGLSYFPPDRALVVEAELLPSPDADQEVMMATTGGSEQIYRRAGVVRFEVEGEPTQLTLFASQGSDELFLPFRDATSGKESYGAGRYLDVEPPEAGHVVVDLNLAYNPYCAYNDAWTCPLPPPENWLRVPIRAGERAYPHDHP